jgi:hypothetical protein
MIRGRFLLAALPLLLASCGGGAAAITVSLQVGTPDPWAGVTTVRLEASGPSMQTISAEAARSSGKVIELPPIPFGPARVIVVEGLDSQRNAVSRGQSAPFEVSETAPDTITFAFTRCAQVYRDEDGDGYGLTTSARAGCGQTGWVAKGGDCDDKDSNAHPGQTQFFTSPTKGTGGWDYDCSGTTEQEFRDSLPACDTLKLVDCKGEGWQGSIPTCGQQGQLNTCQKASPNCGFGTAESKVQGCR